MNENVKENELNSESVVDDPTTVINVACVKAASIAKKAKKKDFYDLYFILNSGLLDAKGLKDAMLSKYYDQDMLAAFCYSVGYFDDVEDEEIPSQYIQYSWKQIKKFFRKFQETFFKAIAK